MSVSYIGQSWIETAWALREHTGNPRKANPAKFLPVIVGDCP